MSDASLRDMLQQYIPTILETDIYFKQFADHILGQYHFKVNEDHLRKKLHIYLEESYRTDSVGLAQRLIRGEYIDDDRDKENWIWLSSQKIGFIAQNIVSSTPIRRSIMYEY